jgi:G:T-mismatch repair DNA endonuclease (very short patch repair protein)
MTRPPNAYIGKEDSFQKSAMAHVRTVVRSRGFEPECAVHIPNGGARGIVTGAKLKAAGVVRGYPDIMVFAPETAPPINRHNWFTPRCGLALELKVWPNKPTKDQEKVHEILRSAGWRVMTCWSLDAVILECRKYFEDK